MYGQIHCVIRELVQKKFGNDTWEAVLKKSGLDEHQAFLMFTRYDDASTFKLVGAVSETLEISVETVLEVFGEFFFDYCIRHGYDKMLQTLGHDIKSFIQNLDSLHALLALSYKGISAPSFRCEDGPDGSLVLHYYSSRPGLYPIVKGVLKAVARDLFDQSVEMSILEQNKEDIGCDKFQEHTAFLVQLRSNSTRSIKSRSSPVVSEKSLVSFNPETVLLKASDFCSAFPYHVIFDRNLKIKQCGVLIQKHSCHVIQEGTPLNLAFDIVHPKMVISIENIRKFINAVFLLAICSEERERKRMVVKGQMIWIEDTQHMIFIGSPRLTSLNELMEMNVYLADIPLYDVTRELVLLNQQRIAEIDIAKKLDETTAQLKKTGQELEEEKRKTETLLHQMLPRKVATALTQGRTVEAEKFDQVTILFSDIVTFTNIASACSPMDIVDMLNEMYRRFDERTSQHHVYKVETIGDAYMIVSGVPEKTNFHAPPVANFAMDMLEDAGQVMSPATGKPLQIRVGVHTGPVVAGVVGVKMPRYCLFGDTVNTASRMESHGVPARIHLSATTRRALQGWGYVFHVRGEMEVKGKGKMCTYFLGGTADRTLAQPDDDFNDLETFLDTDENKVTIKITSDSCEDLLLSEGGDMIFTPASQPTSSEATTQNGETPLENGGGFDENYFLQKADDDEVHADFDVLQNCPFNFGTGFAEEDEQQEQSDSQKNDCDAGQNGCAGFPEEVPADSSPTVDSSSNHVTQCSSLSAENASPTSPNNLAGNKMVVDNVFFNVCCGFSSSMFSNKAYSAVSAAEINDPANTNTNSIARVGTTNPDQSCGNLKTFSTHDPNPTPHHPRPISTPTTNTPPPPTNSFLLFPNRRPTDTSNPSHKKQSNSDKHKTNRSHGNVVSPLQNDILIPDSSSLTSVQSYPAPPPEPHPNHVFRCRSNKPSLQGSTFIGHNKNRNNSNGNSQRKTGNIPKNGSAIESISYHDNAATTTKPKSCSADGVNTLAASIDIGPSRTSVDVDGSSKTSVVGDGSNSNLRPSWSHDHLLKVRKTRKRGGGGGGGGAKKDRSKMCSLS